MDMGQKESKTTRPTNPRDLIVPDDIIKALVADRGPQATLISYKVSNFTESGDNYASSIVSVTVDYNLNEESYLETKFVAKLNPCRGPEFDGFSKMHFSKEIGFYSRILPHLNAELTKIGQPELRVPKLLHFVDKEHFEVLYFNDLRVAGLKLHDRKKSLDEDHAKLIIQELARLHASSIMWMNKEEDRRAVKLLEKYPALIESYEVLRQPNTPVNATEFFCSSFNTFISVAETLPEYKFVSDFLESHRSKATEKLFQLLEVTEPFQVVGHADCWNNNFLFRYDETGRVIDCCMVDFQQARVSSPAIDLNMFVNTTLSGETKKSHLSSLLELYHSCQSGLLEAAGLTSPYSLSQLEEEYRSKAMFGVLLAMVLSPLILLDSKDSPDFTKFVGKERAKAYEDYQKRIVNCFRESLQFRSRFLTMFDDLKAAGVIGFETKTDNNRCFGCV